jgi:hypothetical protein
VLGEGLQRAEQYWVVKKGPKHCSSSGFSTFREELRRPNLVEELRSPQRGFGPS